MPRANDRHELVNAASSGVELKNLADRWRVHVELLDLDASDVASLVDEARQTFGETHKGDTARRGHICSPCSATKAFSSGVKLYAEGNIGGTCWTKSLLRWGLMRSTRGR
eukprot:3163521-Pleurochrysis_carterae.AAC.3